MDDPAGVSREYRVTAALRDMKHGTDQDADTIHTNILNTGLARGRHAEECMDGADGAKFRVENAALELRTMSEHADILNTGLAQGRHVGECMDGADDAPEASRTVDSGDSGHGPIAAHGPIAGHSPIAAHARPGAGVT